MVRFVNLLERLHLSPTAHQVYPSSPWAQGSLEAIVWADVYGQPVGPVTRLEAMAVPAFNKARNLICTTIARLPLVALNAVGELPTADQPSWLYRTDDSVSPFQRMLWTLDDLLWYGHALWWVDRGAEQAILTATRIPPGDWSVEADGSIHVYNEAVNASDVLYFPGHTEGLLEVASGVIRGSRNIDKSVERRAATPVPVMEIHHNDADTVVNGDEARELVAAYNSARRDPEGATVFTPAHIELRDHGANADSGVMVEARNAVRLDVANFTNIPAALLDGSVAVASLTYVTTQGKKSEFIEFSLSPWIETIQSRLSMDDVVPRGQRVRFVQAELVSIEQIPVGSSESRD